MGSLIDGVMHKLDKDTIIYVLSLLDTPSDLARAACVCCSWRKYVIEGEFWKKICIKSFPEIGSKCKFITGSGFSEDLSETQFHGSIHLKSLELQSSTYRLLLQKLLSPPLQRTCIAEPLHASSTDNLPRESVAQTLYPEPEYSEEAHSYWSSSGQASTSVPEMLTYRLVSDLCVIHDIKIQPFLASFQEGHPIYSSQMVRFRFGYARSMKPSWSGLLKCFMNNGKASTDDYIWTYESPAFPMAQENTLQTFRLPKPTVCIGGILQIEFMGRIQTQFSDGLYYICISHVYVTGQPVSGFRFEGVDQEGNFVLGHNTKPSRRSLSPPLDKDDGAHIIEQIRLNRLELRNGSVVDMLLRYLLDAGLLNDPEEE